MKIRIAVVAMLATLFTVACLAGSTPSDPSAHTFGSAINIVWAKDLDGSTNVAQTVVGIQGNPLAPPPAGEGGVAIEWDGSSLYWGTAGGSVTPGDAGQFYVTNDAGVATWVYPHGDVDASASDPGDLTVNAIQGYGVSASVPTTGNQLRWSGSLWGPAALNLAGGSGYVTGTLPTANQASQTLGGELSGTTASGVVAGPFSTAALAWNTSTSAASLGTNKSAATFTLKSGAASNIVQLADGTQNSIALGANLATTGHIRTPQAWSWMSRNASNSSDYPVIQVDGANNIAFGDVSGFSTTLAGGAVVTVASGTGYVALLSGGATVFQGNAFGVVSMGWSSGPSAILGTTLTISPPTEHQSYVTYDAVSSPSVPSATQITVYVDTLDNKLKAKDNAGNVTVLAP